MNWLFNVTINDISVIYVTAHRCAGGLKKKLDLRSGSQRHRHFVGFFNVPVLAPTRDHPFYTVIFLLTLGKTYCQSSRRLSVSETSLACGLVVHINLVIACFVQASDDRLLKMGIDHYNQQLLRLLNRLFPIIGTSLIAISID